MRGKTLVNISIVLYQREKKTHTFLDISCIGNTEIPERTSEVTTSPISTPTKLPPPSLHITTHSLLRAALLPGKDSAVFPHDSEAFLQGPRVSHSYSDYFMVGYKTTKCLRTAKYCCLHWFVYINFFFPKSISSSLSFSFEDSMDISSAAISSTCSSQQNNCYRGYEQELSASPYQQYLETRLV